MSLYRELSQRLGESEFNYAYNLSLKHKYAFVEIPKAACTTLKSVLGEWEFAHVPNDISSIYLSNVHVHVIGTPFIKPFQLGERGFDQFIESDSITRVAFVRNPFTRSLSAYLNKIVMKTWESNHIFDEANLLGLVEPDGTVTFKTFLKCVASVAMKVPVLDRHWRPQHYQLFTSRLRYDFLGRFETLETDLRSLHQRLQIDIPYNSQRLGEQTNTGEKLLEFYDDECAELVVGLYAEDFAQFGYPPILPTS